MKLFGDSGSAKHTAHHEKEAPVTTPAHGAPSKKPAQIPVSEEPTAVFRPVSEPKSAPAQEETVVFSPVAEELPAEEEKAAPAPFFHAPIWRKLRTPLLVLGCVVLLVLAVVLAYSIWEKPPEINADAPVVQLTPKPAVIEETPTPVHTAAPTPPPTEAPEESPEPTEEPAPTGRREDVYTFVLLVYDQLKANTDGILAGRLDLQAGTLDLVNLPRDTLVNVSWEVKKLNTVLPFERNDPERFREHLADLIGFPVDFYAVADLRAVEKLVDCIGGVYYNVPRTMDYDDPTQDLHIHIPAGYQLLTGENAVKVMRFRVGNDDSGYANGDLGRIATQQDFIKTMLSQFLTLGNIPNLTTAIDIVQTYVKTDLTASNISYLARGLLSLDRENIRFHTLPGTGISIRHGSYLEVDLEPWVEIVNNYLNPFYQDITAENLNILHYVDSATGAVSTTGETVPITSFYDFLTFPG